ncbi:ATP-dependent helicase [Streptomyces sp. MNU89]|uniref:ATP-dependent helicase n=1 Tax=Streptomyces sp. MNU89 TaxID=2560025 RepID=UPI001E4B439F|nr:ATP-dependent helicase [Streptomyces sp. MNU89]MCC9741300.1 ATP-dependent helicase [Streptomyces sp. MNU89]
MTGPYEGAPALTDEQRAVVEQPADALLLVTAGPGAGKTHTLVRRLDALLEDEGLSTGEILVLSFSRAAVRELRERLVRSGGEEARQVRVMTFDSWALYLLTELEADTDWRTKSFDERIRAATLLIKEKRTNELYEDSLRHVIIDEVQDLVGHRRQLVESLLATYDCGFTVVGDPAQAITTFQVRDDSKLLEQEPNGFFGWLRQEFPGELIELRLDRNFRVLTDEAGVALRHRNAVLDHSEPGCTGGEDLYDSLRAQLLSLDEYGDLGAAYFQEPLRDSSRSTAVLCRKNGEALLMSDLLHGIGIDHQLRRTARDRSAPAWIEALLRRAGSHVLTTNTFKSLFPDLPDLPRDHDADRMWRLLRACAGDRTGRTVDLSQLRDALAGGRLPDELTAQPSHHLVISTFHRAKGLEFDRVIVVDPGPLRESKDGYEVDPAEEARTLYVALTRAREELHRLPPRITWLVRKHQDTGRWARYGRQKWQRHGLEMLGTDVHSVHPAGTAGFSADPRALQEHLRSELRPGTPLALVRYEEAEVPSTTGDQSLMAPPYLVCEGDRPIGVVSESFRRDLYRFMRRSARHQPTSWPLKITEIRVDAIETVSGSSAAGARAGLGDLGVWLAPRLTGLGHFTYDSGTDKAEGDHA